MAEIRPRLLDLCCCAGGAGKGYHDAGFDVTGVDIRPQPRYPFEFRQADALAFPLDGFDVVHASPPCRDHTPLTSVAGQDGTGWMLAAMRSRLEASGLPWVIENVPGAPMRPDLKLCGCMFAPRLRTYRLRWFEFSHHFRGAAVQPPHGDHSARTATRPRRDRWAQGWNVSVTGDVGVYVGPEALGIGWMTGDELSQAVPPAYTRYAGGLLMTAVERQLEASRGTG